MSRNGVSNVNANQVMDVLQKFSSLLTDKLAETRGVPSRLGTQGRRELQQQLAASLNTDTVDGGTEAQADVKPRTVEHSTGSNQKGSRPPLYATNMRAKRATDTQAKEHAQSQVQPQVQPSEPGPALQSGDLTARSTLQREEMDVPQSGSRRRRRHNQQASDSSGDGRRTKRSKEPEVVYLRSSAMFPKFRRRQGGGACGGCAM